MSGRKYLGREPRNRFGLVDHRLMVPFRPADLRFIAVDPRRQMKKLTVARQQMVEIAKAIGDPRRSSWTGPSAIRAWSKHLHAVMIRLTRVAV